MAREVSRTLRKSLKSDWAEQYFYQQAEYEGDGFTFQVQRLS